MRAGLSGDTGHRRPDRHPAADLGWPVDWPSLQRILAVRLDNLGDLVMLTPALRAVRAAAPQARLDLLASPAGAAIAALVPDLDDVLELSASWQLAGADARADPDAEACLVRRLRDRAYDAMLVFTSERQTPWPAAYAGLLAGIAVRAVHSSEFGGAVATHWITPPPSGTHQVDRSRHLVTALGIADRGGALELEVTDAVRTAAGDVLARHDVAEAPFALLAPGASCAARRYPAEHFGRAAARIAEDGRPVLVTGTAGEADLVARTVAAAAHRDVRALEVVDAPTLTGVIARADVVVCNNSGGLHLADAVGTPVVVTYAGTERLADMWPRDVPSALLQRAVSCSPCRQFACPYDHECLDVSPEEVATVAIRLATEASRLIVS